VTRAFAVLLLLTVPVLTRAAESTRTLLERMERTASRMEGAHPLDRRFAFKELEGFRGAFKDRGVLGVRALAHYLELKDRPLSVRLHAAGFLGSIGDAEGYPALRRTALDSDEDPGLRSTAVLALGSIRVPPRTVRAVFESLLQDSIPPLVEREALGQLAKIGTRSVGATLSAAKRYAASEDSLSRIAAKHATTALEKSPLPEATLALFDLLRHLRGDSPLRGSVLTALSGRNPQGPFSRRDRETLEEILFEPHLTRALQAARLLGRTRDSRAVEALSRLLRTSPSTQLLAEACDALAAIGDPRGREALARLRDGLSNDSRFRMDPKAGEHAARIEAAAAVFDAQATPPPATPPGPAAVVLFRYEGWPGEGRPVTVWAGPGDALALKREPSRAAQDVEPLKVTPGTEVDFTHSLVITRESGLARVSRKAAVSGSSYGKTEIIDAPAYRTPKPTEEFPLKEGDLLEILAYRAEGSCFIRVPMSGRVIESACPENTDFLKILEQPKTDWWLRASGPGGVFGWFLSDAPGLEFRSRRF